MAREVPSVVLELPAVLRPVVGRDRLEVSAPDVAAALERAFEQVPVLRHHLMLDADELRPHVLCLVNGDRLPRNGLAAATLHEGDRIQIHQAISGG